MFIKMKLQVADESFWQNDGGTVRCKPDRLMMRSFYLKLHLKVPNSIYLYIPKYTSRYLYSEISSIKPELKYDRIRRWIYLKFTENSV